MVITENSYGSDAASAINAGGGGNSSVIRVCSYNIGHFAMGRDATTKISDQIPDGDSSWPNCNYDVQLARWKSKVQNIDADIICMPEYTATFGSKNGSNVSTANSGIFDGYTLSVGKTATGSWGYWINAIASRFAMSNVTDVDLASLSGVPQAYVHLAEIAIGGQTVKVGTTHLNWNQSQTHYNSRQSEIKSLIEMFQSDDYVILCGDFNTNGTYSPVDKESGLLEFEPFLYGFTENSIYYSGGFTLANHGIFGDFKTAPATGSKVDVTDEENRPTDYIDNIMVKGFRMSNVVVVDDGHITDHCALVADLTMI